MQVRQAATASAMRRETDSHEVVLDRLNLRVRFCELHRAKQQLGWLSELGDRASAESAAVNLEVRTRVSCGGGEVSYEVSYGVLAPACAYARILRAAPRSAERASIAAAFAMAIMEDGDADVVMMMLASSSASTTTTCLRVHLRGVLLLRDVSIEGGDAPLGEEARARLRASAVSYSPPPRSEGGDDADGENAAVVACPICLEAFAAGDRVVRGGGHACEHLFHASCLDTWLAKRGHCPVCRRRVVGAS